VEVLNLLLGAAAVLAAIVVGVVIAVLAFDFVVEGVRNFWPMMIGVPALILLWKAGHDNIAVVVFLPAVAIQVRFLWRLYTEGGSSLADPPGMSGKKKVYDSRGRLRGYRDP
jgi:hypothetical protein